MLMILLSFPVSYVIYTGVFQVTMNTSLNQITIFIVLGIAADDVFVFCDAWRQSEFLPQIASDQKKRMAYAFKRSFRAIAVTSSTTAVAFLANALSDLRPIRGFGIYAAIIIPVNFFIVILIMPSIQIIHDRYFKSRCDYNKICCKNRCKRSAENQINDSTGLKELSNASKQGKDNITRFFSGPFNKFVHRFRYILIAILLVTGIIAAIIASEIGPLSK